MVAVGSIVAGGWPVSIATGMAVLVAATAVAVLLISGEVEQPNPINVRNRSNRFISFSFAIQSVYFELCSVCIIFDNMMTCIITVMALKQSAALISLVSIIERIHARVKEFASGLILTGWPG
jgi:hypothetical protein